MLAPMTITPSNMFMNPTSTTNHMMNTTTAHDRGGHGLFTSHSKTPKGLLTNK